MDKDRMTGKKEEIAGWTKEHFGSFTGDEQREAEGRAQKLKGQSMQDTAKVEQQTKGAKEEAVGGIKQTAGEALGSDKMKMSGAAQEKTGEARQRMNQ